MRTSHQMSQWKSILLVKDYKLAIFLITFFAKSVILKVEFASEEMQAAVGNNCGKLQFNYFRNTFKKIANNKKCLLNPNDKLL